MDNKRKFKLITAFDKNQVIGKGLGLPWKISADLKRVKELTIGKCILMGRKTFDSLNRKPLPGRKNIVVGALNEGDSIKYCNETTSLNIYQSLDEALEKASNETFIFGGASIYEQCLPFVNEMYITKVFTEVSGENLVYFPEIDWENWKLEEASEIYKKDDKNEFDYQFLYYKRK